MQLALGQAFCLAELCAPVVGLAFWRAFAATDLSAQCLSEILHFEGAQDLPCNAVNDDPCGAKRKQPKPAPRAVIKDRCQRACNAP